MRSSRCTTTCSAEFEDLTSSEPDPIPGRSVRVVGGLARADRTRRASTRRDTDRSETTDHALSYRPRRHTAPCTSARTRTASRSTGSVPSTMPSTRSWSHRPPWSRSPGASSAPLSTSNGAGQTQTSVGLTPAASRRYWRACSPCPYPLSPRIYGHAFGVGAMLATAYDWRVMRADRGSSTCRGRSQGPFHARNGKPQSGEAHSSRRRRGDDHRTSLPQDPQPAKGLG